MTWKEFKEQAEAKGITNDMIINIIDTIGCFTDDIELQVIINEKDNSVTIYASDA